MDDADRELPPILLPGYEARVRARAILVLTGLVIGIAAFVWVASPGFIGGWSDPRPLDALVPLTGVGMLVFGLGWMIRIYRSAMTVEPDQEHWRYRDR